VRQHLLEFKVPSKFKDVAAVRYKERLFITKRTGLSALFPKGGDCWRELEKDRLGPKLNNIAAVARAKNIFLCPFHDGLKSAGLAEVN
jgi:hypothetical protein